MSEAINLLRKSILEKVPYELSNAEHVKVENIKDASFITIYEKEFNLSDPSKYNAYSLASVLFLLKNQNIEHSTYFQECLTANIPPISIIDKKEIIDYLTGQTNKIKLNDADLKADESSKSVKEKRGSSEIEGVNESAKKQKIDENDKDIEIVKQITARERTLQNRKSILQFKGTKTFESAHKIATDIFLSENKPKPKEGTTSQKESHHHRSHSKTHGIYSKSQELGIPIIIVPSAPTSLINMYNVKKFLEEKKYLEPQECRKLGIRKEAKTIIKRERPNGRSKEYFVVDSVDKFRDQDWDNVVAIFTCGAAWQFKGWKWPNPTELFSKIRGFYLQYQDDILKEPVKEWNVKVLKVEKYKRHHDIQTVLEFWNELDRYMSIRG